MIRSFVYAAVSYIARRIAAPSRVQAKRATVAAPRAYRWKSNKHACERPVTPASTRGRPLKPTTAQATVTPRHWHAFDSAFILYNISDSELYIKLPFFQGAPLETRDLSDSSFSLQMLATSDTNLDLRGTRWLMSASFIVFNGCYIIFQETWNIHLYVDLLYLVF